MYSERPPPEPLRRLVRCCWESVEPGPKRIVPDGCVDLVAGGGEVFVAGPDTAAWTSVFPPGTRLRGLRFRPGTAAAMLGVGADELRDRRVSLPDLWNHRGATLADEILDGRDLADAMSAVATDQEVQADPVVERMLAQFTAEAAGGAEIPGGRESAAHDRSAWHPGKADRSERQARRLFTLAVGYGPATYRRILRLQRAIALAPATASLADLAVAAGYSDQPHLTRECRALTGLTPSAYFAP
ncbi:helix-turn-helix domain-containing protein [Amycolatopsis sp. NPDC059090]|uniref:AraC family transcriptional regulator n=1 Tax=unclassified Amycolatopsis TaxID=2618356 RepID=UPI003671FBF3